MDSILADLDVSENNQVKGSLENCMKILKRDPLLKGAISKNELTCREDIVKPMPWKRTGATITDFDVYHIHWYFEQNYHIVNERNINKAIHIIAGENSYHPIKKLLEGLEWDGVPRIDSLLPKYLGTDDSQYTREVMHLLMQALIHRIYGPGCKFEIMICLVGGQGAGKSTFFRLLAINDDWFSDDLKKLDDEKVYRKLQGHWIMEMSEMLATVNARSIEDIKSFLSRQRDNYKIPYETHPEDRPRQCVFVGTTNNVDFLPQDRTGNRRFAPVRINAANVEKHILEDEAESRAYILQAWAEAFHIYMNSDKHILKFSNEIEDYVLEVQQEFMPEDTKFGLIMAWLEAKNYEYVSSRMIFEEVLPRDDFDTALKRDINEVNDVMNSIPGWEKKNSHRFPDGRIGRAWHRLKSNDNEGFIPVCDQMEIPFD